MSDAEAFYCLMVGSRSFSDYEFFVTKCDHLLRNWKNIIIVSGGAYGTDTLAKRYAADRHYAYKEFPADWDTYGKRAGYIRNRLMHEYISKHVNRGVIPKAIRSVCRTDCHHRIGRLCFMACSCSYEYQIAQRRFRGR